MVTVNFNIETSDQSFYFVCFGFYAISTVFQLFKGYSSQILVCWTVFNQSIILTLAGQS